MGTTGCFKTKNWITLIQTHSRHHKLAPKLKMCWISTGVLHIQQATICRSCCDIKLSSVKTTQGTHSVNACQ
jgi:hypothetical protein